MRLGIQAKLVTTLVLAGLLPLLLSLAVVLVAAKRIRTNSVGQSLRSVAQQGASQLSAMLSAQIELVGLIGRLPGTVELVETANAVPPLSPEQIAEIEKRWPELSAEDDPLLRSILHHPLAERWRAVRSVHPRFAEVIVTDASGRVIAATNKTSDYFQADERWWQACYAQGEGHLFLSDIAWDESAISMSGTPGAIVATLCVPIEAPAAGAAAAADRAGAGKPRVVGVMKIALDAGWMLQRLAGLSSPSLPNAAAAENIHQIWLVRDNGEMVPDGVGAPIARAPAALMRQVRLFDAGWTEYSGIDSKELIGFAAVEMPHANISSEGVQWHVLVGASRKQMLGPIYRMLGMIAAIGVAVIVICFLAGLMIARREVVRPVMMLSRGAHELERENFAFRLPAPPAGGSNDSFRDDELGRLARDFNRMAGVLQHSVEQLERAGEMKRQFIDLASHELRTPVTYIAGVSELARRQGASVGDAQRTAAVLDKIHAKAQRLGRIVDNMFKLLGSGRFGSELARSPIDLAAIIREVCRDLEPFLASRRQRWDLRLAGDLPMVLADAEKIRDVLSNLLSNAIRFSPDEQSITVTANRQDDDCVAITVADRGPGIDDADLPRLFEPFFTAGEARGADLMHHTSGEYAHQTRGIGLGLSVVKRFVELHGGTVSVATSPNGTEFTVRLPIDAARTNAEG